MTSPADPLAGGLAAYGRRLRAGETTAEATTRAYLDRIEALDGDIGAYQHVSAESALAQARAIDALLESGTDLGPLMGAPLAIKDLLAVDGMPVTAGSLLDVSDLIGAEGPFVRKLRRLGCVILGKTRTVEFAFGVTGASAPRGTPRNPADMETPRAPGGSSSGSAAAMAAGLCGFAIGSDTGGSVRIPAALCGVFGLKTTHGLWPTEGVFPLAPHLDTLGLLTRDAEDAAIIHAALDDTVPAAPASLDGLRLARPGAYFFKGLDADVAARTEAALARLTGAGCSLTEVEIPEPAAREAYFPLSLSACLVAALGAERVREGRERMDPLVARRTDAGAEARAADLLRLERRRTDLMASAHERAANLDAWVCPTAAIPAPAIAALEDPEEAMRLTLGMTQNTQPANYLNLAGVTIPLAGSGLPVGLQLLGAPLSERRLLAISRAVEALLRE
ncbi:amidase [Pikeienuella piscinae]|uniref:Amidase n=1 Tax=Pikeienuella piscinae TaxID=2748098 RepID=A0A7L5BWH3_9RHOB|nr:amidase [Pikeienuella piscinae]QIE56760.1 amidase [Pikeienuella piscinae]